MAPAPSPPLSRTASAPDDKALPSLNELFPEDLFRGSLPHQKLPSSSFHPLSVQASSFEQHTFPRGGERQPPARSHPQHTRSHTPPPHTTHTSGPCSTACSAAGRPSSSSSSSSTQILPSHAHSPRTWPQPAIPGPSHPPYSAGAGTSALRSPADELVSAIAARAGAPNAHAPHLAGLGLGLGPGPASSFSAPLEKDAGRHPTAHPHSSGRDRTRFPDAALPVADPAPLSLAASLSGRGKAPTAHAPSTAADDSERRHCCPHCNKRFNRPSSLAIHVNTHTGAKPFTCAFPGCNRKFNVNSNMRRHYRNHLTARRRDVIARMVPPGAPAASASMSPPPSAPLVRAPSSSHPYAHPSMYPHPAAHLTSHGHPARAASYGSGSGSRSPSRSPSWSPSPMPSPSPSPLPSPVSAVTSPFPPTPRSLPATASPARGSLGAPYVHTQHAYVQHRDGFYSAHSLHTPLNVHDGHAPYAHEQQKHPRAHASPTWPAHDFDERDTEDGDGDGDGDDEADEDEHSTLTGARESFVRGDRERRRSPAETRRRARPGPYPRRASSVSASPPVGGAPMQRQQEQEKQQVPGCDVPGCTGCSGPARQPRLRPAFRDGPRGQGEGGGGGGGHPGWTVLEDDGEED